MSVQAQKITLEEIVKSIDIPDSAYEKAQNRYQDLGEWFSKPQAACSGFSPHIYPQGSFRLGTVNRPIEETEKYDLDMGCRLRVGFNKHLYSQKQLKQLVQGDLEAYRKMRQIKEELEEKHRCWCLNYADELSFHMDIVPSIPEAETLRKSIQESMVKRGADVVLAESVAQHAGAITDNRDPNYAVVSLDWRVSNSEGYALWFQSRLQLAKLLEKSSGPSAKAQIDDLPLYKKRTPLQRCVQILKRHRDTMFASDPEGKPASIIITTLAAQAYQGESDIVVATQNILSKMGGLVGIAVPRIPNPINPAEDFADRWYSPRGQRLKLEENFWLWLKKATVDVSAFGSSDDADYLLEKSLSAFKTSLNPIELKEQLRAHSPVGAFAIGGIATATPSRPVDPRGGGRFG